VESFLFTMVFSMFVQAGADPGFNFVEPENVFARPKPEAGGPGGNAMKHFWPSTIAAVLLSVTAQAAPQNTPTQVTPPPSPPRQVEVGPVRPLPPQQNSNGVQLLQTFEWVGNNARDRLQKIPGKAGLSQTGTRYQSEQGVRSSDTSSRKSRRDD
jgi:hypothetical protein